MGVTFSEAGAARIVEVVREVERSSAPPIRRRRRYPVPIPGQGEDHGCRAYGTPPNLAAGASGVLTLASEAGDTDGFHDGVSNTERLTIPSGLGGTYLVGWVVEYTLANSPSAVSSLRVQLRLGGSGTNLSAKERRFETSSGTVWRATLSGTARLVLAATNYLDLYGTNLDGGNTILGAWADFWLHKVDGAAA